VFEEIPAQKKIDDKRRKQHILADYHLRYHMQDYEKRTFVTLILVALAGQADSNVAVTPVVHTSSFANAEIGSALSSTQRSAPGN